MESLQIVETLSVFKYFKEISIIPRGSGNEKEISNYLVKFAQELNLEVIQDSAMNVIIKKPASKGYEGKETIILQGHMDMVCEKNDNIRCIFGDCSCVNNSVNLYFKRFKQWERCYLYSKL